MANIVLRSPQYKSFTSHSNANSAKMTITISGTLRYTIIKQCSGSQIVTFEIAELCRRVWSVRACVRLHAPGNLRLLSLGTLVVDSAGEALRVRL